MSSEGSTVKRRGKAGQPQDTAASRSSTAPTSDMSPLVSTVPTSTELAFLSIFPVTLVLGSLFSLLSPETRQGLYDPRIQSFPPEVAPSYFARKNNIFNRYFVKVGWFWVTVAFATFTAVRALRRTQLHKTALGTQRHGLFPPAVQSVLRWTVATTWWYAVTQWFFGPALIDRGFRWTGGRCHIALAKGPNDMARNADVEQLVTAAACRAIGGAWHGGHDISGHVFLLVLGSAFLGMEILPAVLRNIGSTAVQQADKGMESEDTEPDAGETAVRYVTWFAGFVGMLCLWMLLMTAAYFHTWFEKVGRSEPRQALQDANSDTVHWPQRGICCHRIYLLLTSCSASIASRDRGAGVMKAM